MTLEAARPSLVGAKVRRVNDPRLLTGSARFVDDYDPTGVVHATMLRSPLAHGEVTSFRAAAARDLEGVHLSLGPDEIAGKTAPLPCVWLVPGQRQTSVPVASRHVYHVGQAVGVVVADSRALAEDAADLVDVEYDERAPVADVEAALADDAPLLHPEWGTNVAARLDVGDSRGDIEDVFQRAAHVVSRRLRIQRVAPNPMETRGVLAVWEPVAEQLTVRMSTQVPHHVRDHLAGTLGLRAEQVRVIAEDVGGGFGAKEHLYADEVLACLAAIETGRPVKWVEDRGEHLTATFHARDAVHYGRLALDENGRFLAIDSEIKGNLGAHPSNVGTGPFRISATMLPGPYHYERAGATITAALTTTTPTGAYRGFGMQEAAWVRERLVDEAARELEIDPVELRLRNMIGPEQLPLTTPTLQDYDSGDYPGALRKVAELARQHETRSTVRVRRGVGFASQVEFTGLGPSRVQQIVGFHLGGYETASVRMEPDGSVEVSCGLMGMGQGIETTLAQLVADRLDVPMGRVSVRLGDTAIAPYSAAGSMASRSITVGGGATVVATERLRTKLIAIAANMLEADPEDVEFADERFQVTGVPDAKIGLQTVAENAWLGWELPDGMEPGLAERHIHDPEDISYSYSTHAVAVAVDIETGFVALENYWVAHDSGVLVNPMIADGQIVGGIAQGAGIALHEAVVYGGDGQPLTTSYLDYVLPATHDIPDVAIEHMCTPSPFIPGGMKGLGEGGTINSTAAIGNAVAAAVPEIAGDLVETPLSPDRVWTLADGAGLHEVRR